MYFDRFDIVEAHFLFCSHYHDGQASPLYARMCRILTYFRPRPNLECDTLEENGQEIYRELERKAGYQPTI